MGAGDQSANADNLVQEMLGKIRPEGLPHILRRAFRGTSSLGFV